VAVKKKGLGKGIGALIPDFEGDAPEATIDKLKKDEKSVN